MTGLGNERILENFRNIQALGVRTRVRIPVIPGYNDSRENWDAVIAFLKPYPQVAVELLPYHSSAAANMRRSASAGRCRRVSRRRMPPCRHTGRIWRAAACAACGEATANRMQNV